ncbi:uncharacterized protein LOC113385054 [Ctenocephalides felis]|uniref:uncharacterized protein LOC113385054 n=1 Tax=Ctenocephalides felis TaxID=7515 RepID=UPI000E6E2830|nr:uncharacterized protein LOC113385054 [Ctenocephalides felis]
MFFRACIFLLLIAVISINGDQGCDKNQVYRALRDLRDKLQITKASNRSEAFNLYKSMLSYEDGVELIENQIALCPENIQNQLKAIYQLAFGIATVDAERIQNTMKVIDDDHLLEEFVGLHYAVDSFTVVTFLTTAPFDESLRVSKTLNNLLRKTDLNNTEIDTKLEVISHLNQELKNVKEPARLESLKKLLRQLIKTDIILQHDNIEHLIKIDEELTKDVIQELIGIHTAYNIENQEQLALFPLLLELKCSSNFDIWIDNLNALYGSLKSHDKIYTIQTLFLLKEVNALLKLFPENKILLDIQAQIPISMNFLLASNVCVKSKDVNKPIDMYLMNVDTGKLGMIKFEPNPDGPHMLVVGPAGGYNFTIVLSTKEGMDDALKSFRVEKTIGTLGLLTIPEFCEKNDDIVLQGCVPLEKLLASGLAKPQHLGVIKQLARNFDRILKDTIDESCGDNTVTASAA